MDDGRRTVVFMFTASRTSLALLGHGHGMVSLSQCCIACIALPNSGRWKPAKVMPGLARLVDQRGQRDFRLDEVGCGRCALRLCKTLSLSSSLSSSSSSFPSSPLLLVPPRPSAAGVWWTNGAASRMQRPGCQTRGTTSRSRPLGATRRGSMGAWEHGSVVASGTMTFACGRTALQSRQWHLLLRWSRWWMDAVADGRSTYVHTYLGRDIHPGMDVSCPGQWTRHRYLPSRTKQRPGT